MKCFRVSPLAALFAALALASGQADAADLANPAGFANYGYGDGGYGYGGASYVPGTAGYSNPTLASYPGYAGYGYAGYGYTGPGTGGFGCGNCGCDLWAGYCGGRRRHHCSFGGNAGCCAGVWDGYCSGGCGAPVKVHRRHRPLGCGAGPCVDAACCGALSGYPATCGPHWHRCHLRRNRNCGYPIDACCGYGGSMGVMDAMPGQPNMANPNGAELLQAPPGFDSEEPPAPTPAEESST